MADQGNEENKDRKPKPNEEAGAGDPAATGDVADDEQKVDTEDKATTNGTTTPTKAEESGAAGDKGNLKDTASPSLRRIDENSEMQSSDNEEREPFVPRISKFTLDLLNHIKNTLHSR